MTERHDPRATNAPTDQILALHAQDIADAAGLWRDGLAAFRQTLAPLDSSDPRAPRHAAVQVVLLRAALDGLASSHARASDGEYGFALAEVRAPFERFIATAFLGLHPDEHHRFAEAAGEPPSLTEMKDRLLVRMLPKYGETIARGWRRKIDRWDEQLSPAGLGMSRATGGDGSGTHGPARAGEAGGVDGDFEVCMEQACGVMSLLLTQAIRVRRDLGHPDVPSVKLFAWRFGRWRKHVRRSRAQAAGEEHIGQHA